MGQSSMREGFPRLLGLISVSILLVVIMRLTAAPVFSTPGLTLNVRDFGATGDGKTKNTGAIQQASIALTHLAAAYCGSAARQ